MSTHFKRILYGGDYNPNQWTKDIWQEDMRIFKDAHINTATINVFSWAKIQPSEHEYNFDELDEIYRKDHPRPTEFNAIRKWEKERLMTLEHQVMEEIVYKRRE